MGIISSKNKGKKNLLDLKDEILDAGEVEKDQSELSELTLKFDALWSLFKKKTSLVDSDLEEMIQKLRPETKEDILKKVANKEIEAKNCPKCGRACSASTGNCLYCGADEESVAQALAKLGLKGD